MYAMARREICHLRETADVDEARTVGASAEGD